MKIKPVKKTGGVIVELGPTETQLSHLAEEKTSVLPIFQLKRILVPVDFSECTEGALRYAVPFARQFGAELLLLHVIELPYSPASEAGIIPTGESMEDARKNMENLRDSLPGDVRCEILVRTGGPEFEVIAVAKECESDLIILSTHGRTGLGRMIVGSVTEKVVRRAPCPVLIVREHEHEFVSSCGFDASHSETTVGVEPAMKTGI